MLNMANYCCCYLAAKSWPTLLDPMDCRLLCPWDFPGKHTEAGCHFFLQGIFLTQGLNPHLLHWQVDSLPLSHREAPNLKASKDSSKSCLTLRSHEL